MNDGCVIATPTTPATFAARAIDAANVQRTAVIGQAVAASVVARLAQTFLDLNADSQ